MTPAQQTLLPFIDEFTDRQTSAVTFKGKMNAPIHRWYRLTPSFSPALAMDIAAHFHLDPKDYVLDPFSGVGTVPVCMKYAGIPACSIELNPYLHFVSTVKTRTYGNAADIRVFFEEFLALAREETRSLTSTSATQDYLADHENFIPPIRNPERWWSPPNLAQLVAIRKLVYEAARADHAFDLLRMGVLGILIPVSNAKHNHVSLTFATYPRPAIDVVGVLQCKLTEIITDIERMCDRPCADVEVFSGNSRRVDHVLPQLGDVSAVITSPPYPNRFSYARETRPHMFFFDFISDARAVGELETEAMGGTWGRATSVLMKEVVPANEVVSRLLGPFLAKVNGEQRLMANYVTKYFNNMYEHAEGVAKVCRPHAKLAYVIGNSQFYGNSLPSDEILAAIFAQFGFSLERISKMRRRQSKSGLYEAVVFMSR